VLVRSLGIPCISGLPEALLGLPAGTEAALDGGAGTLWVAPDRRTRSRIEAGRSEWLRRREAAAALRREPAVSRDGRHFEVEANIAAVSQARQAVEQGAEGVGVLRTEFLFLERAHPPTEQEQLEALREIAAQLQGRPLTVRSLDVGGDKPLAYLSQPAEANPYLGLRGVRLCLLRQELFQTQLRAVLRAAERHPLRLLLPMITTLEELEGALAQLAQARAGLVGEGLPHRWPIPVGMMVETPSAALLIDAFLERVDFLSIGTNDLTQYTLAAERGNPALAGYQDALHPAVLALIRQVAAAAGRRGKGAAVCGEIAGDPLAAPVLAGLGVSSFSLNPPGIPRIKETLRRVNTASAARWAKGLLHCPGAAAVRRRAAAYYGRLPQA
jgi:phosphoenolpyruvate-protein phosphotransferase